MKNQLAMLEATTTARSSEQGGMVMQAFELLQSLLREGAPCTVDELFGCGCTVHNVASTSKFSLRLERRVELPHVPQDIFLGAHTATLTDFAAGKVLL
jgi:hypothetical protein